MKFFILKRSSSPVLWWMTRFVLCGVEVETSAHIIWQCPTSSVVWADCRRSIQKSVISVGEFLPTLELLINRLSMEDLELVSLIIQQLWFRRNKVVFGGAVMNYKTLVKCAQDTLEAFHQTTVVDNPASRTSANPCLLWKSPPFGQLKLNWDVSVDYRSKQMGVGLLLRDHNGIVRVAKCTTICFVADPLVAEALVARMGVELCREMGFLDILLEGDAQVLFQALSKKGRSWVGMAVL